MCLVKLDIASNKKDNMSPLSLSPKYFANVFPEQFWSFENFFLTFLSKLVSPWSHF